MSFLKKLFRSWRAKQFSYQPLVRVVLSAKALEHNYHEFETGNAQKRVAPVLKSNAYGHGLLLVAKKLDALKPPFMVVDSYYEALMLKNESIKSDILIMGYTRIENILRASRDGMLFCITTMPQLEILARELKTPMRFHLKIDTGMHRQGIAPKDLSAAIVHIRANKYMQLEGICSHFADADTQHSQQTQEQIAIWNELYERVQHEIPSVRYGHIEATAGTQWGSKIHANAVRVGLGLYGIDSIEEGTRPLRPVLSLKSIVVGIKELTKGDKVGYNGTYEAPGNMRIGIVPAGYYEGVDRRLSNKGYMSIKGVNCPIVGKVSMNMTTIDVSSVPNIKEGDEVEIISNNPKDKNSIIFLTQLCDVIPYEILVRIPERIRREWEN